ncbi:MAG TPA: hypothetical protein VF756_23510 [Thermoanaerobaculia bacterium]
MSTKKILAITLLAAGLTVARASAAKDNLWIHIHVQDGKDGKVSINLPLSMLEKSSAFIPGEARSSGRIRFDDEDITVAELREVWKELQRQPDATYITVDEVDSKVRVAKVGSYLHVRARDMKHGRNENVEMKIPVSVVSALLSGTGDELDVAAAVREIARQGEGELVTVTGDNETVRIWVDSSSESR